ncbi:unnamed protein product [Protopolystoma xenopodis]|uniref:Uncharacterized protein n=1 Tax=Protopolystoma xenopodis TaxID=117903 RepID=A0A448XN28_9PLAT|nr:unnamed protein product [Protopolystoma xenopodis]
MCSPPSPSPGNRKTWPFVGLTAIISLPSPPTHKSSFVPDLVRRWDDRTPGDVNLSVLFDLQELPNSSAYQHRQQRQTQPHTFHHLFVTSLILSKPNLANKRGILTSREDCSVSAGLLSGIFHIPSGINAHA